MLTVLSTKVDAFDGFTELSATPGLITLTDDNMFEMAKRDPTTGEITETVMHVGLSELSVRNLGSNMIFVSGNLKKTVGFSFGARSVRMFGLIGLLIGQLLAARSGQGAWVAELRRRNVPVRGGPMSPRTALALTILVVAALVAALVLPRIGSH